MDIDTLRAKWDEFAPAFERRFEASTLQLSRTLAANSRLQDASAVLEVGCGAGGGALEALRFLSVVASGELSSPSSPQPRAASSQSLSMPSSQTSSASGFTASSSQSLSLSSST